MPYADVIVPLAVEGMYTYLVPSSLESEVVEGTLVWVTFAGNKKYTALVYRLHEQVPAGITVKPIEGIADEMVKFSSLHLKFLAWISEYYMATPGEVMKAALPVAFRLESFTSISRTTQEIDYVGLSENERMILAFLKPGEYVSLKEVKKYVNIRSLLPLVKDLLARNYVCVKETVDEWFREKTERIVCWDRKFSEEELGEWFERLKRAPAQQNMFARWVETGKAELERSEFLRLTGQSSMALKGLCEKRILRVEERVCSRLSACEETGGYFCHLNEEQQQALLQIQCFFEQKNCVLLRGVTSSGKTEVYIHLIREYLARGKQVLYMLPEIALTIQIVRRLQKAFGNQVGIYHSGMSDAMRAELWKKQCSERPFRLILGVRSSIFLPFRELGLIIVDEEHDMSYKQKEPAPRYQGRDVAIMLAKMFGAHVLLGSATPSFESFQHALSGKYGYVQMDNRFGGVQMPEIQLVDVGEFRRKRLMQGSFSPSLVDEIRKVLQERKQVILFQNRRGYASYVQCDRCGEIPKCPHCDVSMTYYKQRHVLMCRYCGSMRPMVEQCTSCGNGHYRERVPGTERIEEEIHRLFPESRVARMDLDVMGSKARFRAVIEDFEEGKIDILVGTQMVTKGLDFEHVKLVGVMDADSMVNFPDFRAEERAFAMLMQVSGRCGRKGERGKVMIQTADMENRVYQWVMEGNFRTFFDLLEGERKLFMYPPFGRMIQIELRQKDAVQLRNAANLLASRLREHLGKRVCGPAVPEIGKIAGMYRLVLLLKLENGISYSGVKELLRKELIDLHREKQFGTIRIFCDVDPQ